MYTHTPPPNSFFMFLGLSSLDKLYSSISTSAFFTLEFSQDSEIAKIAYFFFHPLNSSLESNALLSSTIVCSINVLGLPRNFC